ncbi:MAG: hypothetical protein GW938_15665 [Leptospira sp.]|nr:hypothetical protein [Leptospira sp.]
MIYILVRETLIELPDRDQKIINRLNIIAASNLEVIQDYCDRKNYKRFSGSGNGTMFKREIDIEVIKKELKKYFDLKTAIRVEERFIIEVLELKGAEA